MIERITPIPCNAALVIRLVWKPPPEGTWLVRAGDRGMAGKLIGRDPFFTTGLRKSARIPEWRRVFADGARLI